MPVLESVACGLCHKRKVKCDKSRPGCRKCAQYGRPCPGYTVSQTFTFVEHTVKRRNARALQTPSPSSDGSPGSTSDPWDKLHSRVLEKSRARNAVHRKLTRGPLASRTRQMEPMNAPASVALTTPPVSPPLPNPLSAVSYQPSHRIALFDTLLTLLQANDKISAFNACDLRSVAQTDVSRPSVDAALNALCYVGIGTAHGDRKMIFDARAHYDVAVRHLNALIRLGISAKYFRPVVTTMLMLRHCELFSTFSREMGWDHDWRWHVGAMQYYVEHCGPQDLIHDEHDWNLLQAVRFHSLFLDVDQKRPSVFAQRQWLALTAKRAEYDPFYALYDLRVQVGGLLARVEQSLQAPPNPLDETEEAGQSLLYDLLSLRDKFGAWINKHGVVHTSVHSVVSAEIAIIRRHPGARRLFENCHFFPDAGWASMCTTCWLWGMRLDCAILQLMDNSPGLAVVAGSSRAEVQAHADYSAESLCRSIYWCCRPDIAQFPEVGTFHLGNVECYYHIMQSAEGLAWCRALEDVINVKGQIRSDTDPASRFAMALSPHGAAHGAADRIHISRWVQATHSRRTIWGPYEGPSSVCVPPRVHEIT